MRVSRPAPARSRSRVPSDERAQPTSRSYRRVAGLRRPRRGLRRPLPLDRFRHALHQVARRSCVRGERRRYRPMSSSSPTPPTRALRISISARGARRKREPRQRARARGSARANVRSARASSDLASCTRSSRSIARPIPSLRPRQALDTFWSCLATVKSCGDVDRCVFPAGVQECVAVAERQLDRRAEPMANGGVRLECSGDAGRAHGVEPCALSGRTCSSPSGDPSIAKCSGALGFACTGDGGTCSGTSAVDCRPSGTLRVDQGVDCSGYGAGQCAFGDGGARVHADEDRHHLPRGHATASATARSSGRVSQARTFASTARLSAFRATSRRCRRRTRRRAASSAESTACTNNDTCPTPTTLRSCGRGATYDVDCSSAGLGKCLIDTAGHGACSPPP